MIWSVGVKQVHIVGIDKILDPYLPDEMVGQYGISVPAPPYLSLPYALVTKSYMYHA